MRKTSGATPPSSSRTGHHWDPLLPDPPFPGSFAGRELHAHHYKSMDELRGKRVVVVGMGNSAMDIAVESSEVAERTFLSATPGRARDPEVRVRAPRSISSSPPARLPWAVRQRMGEALQRLAVGDMERYGLPKPDHRLGEAHPTISGRILDRLTHGAITPKPNIAELEGDRVRFTDGTVELADVIVYCTGYKVTFPFFDPSFVSAKDNDLPLFMRVFHPEHDGLCSSASSSRSARSCRSPRRRGNGSRAGSSVTTRFRRRARCARRSRTSAAACSLATSNRSATRCRSTSTTTCSSWPRNAPPAPGAPRTIHCALTP